MRWLYTAFSSSCSPVPSSTGDNRTNNRSVGSYHRRHGTGSMNHRQFTDNDVVPVISRSISTPHILPLPMLSALFKRDSAADEKSTDVFPSREDANKKFDDNRGISNVNHGHSKTPQRLTSLNSSSNTENKESQFLKKCRKKFTSTTSSKDLYSQYETVSAPTTPISNLTLIPSTSKISMSNGIQLQDMTSGFTYHHHRSKYHLDVSSVHSPSSSPLHRKMSIKSQTNQSDNNIQASVTTVYPLPLPPGAAGVPPSSPPQTCNRPDLVAETSSQSQSQWRKGKLIGRGTFGSVYVGSNRETGALCAMKEVEILPDDPKSAESIKQLQQEIDVLSQLKHPNIVQYYGSEIVKNRFYIYLEYVHPGSINKYVRDHYGGMTESIVRNFTRHIVSGLAYLHSTKTIHRDIKGANLLVDANGVVKLADFGMAKHLDGQVILSLKGSPYWMAPELLHSKPQKDGNPDFALAVDIWSLGCTIIEMMNGKPPWSEHEGAAAMFKVMKETPPIPETMSPEGKDFLRCCFIRNPTERPTAIMLLEHKFLMVQKERVCSR